MLAGHACGSGPGTSCHQALLSHFGRENIASQEPPYPIDRRLLGNLVFSDPSKLKELNSIVWPEILKQILAITKEIENNAMKHGQHCKRPVIILDAAVLLQAGWDQICNEVCFLFCVFAYCSQIYLLYLIKCWFAERDLIVYRTSS
ncbi:unnamed protein product [Trichobilharzia regenti]|nr:unnamed protein product [Trichobilharzia regenti]